MAYTDLRDFIRALEKEGELKRVAVEADPVLEIAEFADQLPLEPDQACSLSQLQGVQSHVSGRTQRAADRIGDQRRERRIVFLRGVNVGGHRTFRPSILARELSDYDVVNVGAAGTFVVQSLHVAPQLVGDSATQERALHRL